MQTITQPLVSILIPANSLEDLQERIQNALDQVYQNRQILVLDYAELETDSTSIAACCSERGVQLCPTEKKNLLAAIQSGANIQKGDFFCILMPGDRYHPQKIAKQMSFIHNLHLTNVLLLSGYSYYETGSDEKVSVAITIEKTREFIYLLAETAQANLSSALLPACARTCFTDKSLTVEHPLEILAALSVLLPVVNVPYPLVQTHCEPFDTRVIVRRYYRQIIDVIFTKEKDSVYPSYIHWFVTHNFSFTLFCKSSLYLLSKQNLHGKCKFIFWFGKKIVFAVARKLCKYLVK